MVSRRPSPWASDSDADSSIEYSRVALAAAFLFTGSKASSDSESLDEITVVRFVGAFDAGFFPGETPVAFLVVFPLSCFVADALFCTPFLLAMLPFEGASPLGLGALNGALCFADELDVVRFRAIEIDGRSLK